MIYGEKNFLWKNLLKLKAQRNSIVEFHDGWENDRSARPEPFKIAGEPYKPRSERG